jgi:Flp pilus assembly protein TadG
LLVPRSGLWVNAMRVRDHFKVAQSVRKDETGTSTLELALVLPIGLMLVLGAIDSSLAFAEKLRAEAAAARAIEQITAFSRVNTDYTASRAEAAAAAGVPVDDVTVTYWLECGNVVQGSFTATCASSSAQIARFVKVTVRGKFEPVMNYGNFLQADSNGVVRVLGDASVRVQ